MPFAKVSYCIIPIQLQSQISPSLFPPPEDASVPIYKGRSSGSRGGSSSGSDSRHKSRQPYDPKSQWNPNFSSEHGGGIRYSPRSGAGSDVYYPQYYPEHVYTSSSGADTGSIYRNGETWTHYVPVWTTERAPHEQSQLQRQPSWKPCYCMSSYGTDYRRRRDNKAGHKGVVRGNTVHVNGKLDQPFS